MRLKFLLFIGVLLSPLLFFGQVGIGTSSPDPSSALDIQATTNDKGLLIPRLTISQRNAMSGAVSPANGLLIFQTDSTPGFYYYSTVSASWVMLGTSSGGTDDQNISGSGFVSTTANLTIGIESGSNEVVSLSSLEEVFVGSAPGSPSTGYLLYNIGTNKLQVYDGSWMDVDTNTDSQTIVATLSGTILQLLPENTTTTATVDLASLSSSNTDSQTLVATLSGTILELLPDNVTTTVTLDLASIDTNTDTDSQTIVATLSGTILQLLPENTTTTATVDLASLSSSNTDTQTLQQVTAQGTQTTDAILVGGLIDTGTLVVFGDSELQGNVDLGSSVTNTIDFNGKVGTSVFFDTNTYDIGDLTNQLNNLYVNNVKSKPTESLYLDTVSADDDVVLANGGTAMAGVDSLTFYVGDFGTSNYYRFPTTRGISGQVLTVSSTTEYLYFENPNSGTDTQTLQQVTSQGTITTDNIRVGGLTVSGTTRVTIGDDTSSAYYTLPLGTDSRASFNVLTVSTTANTLYFAPVTYVETQGLSDVTSNGSITLVDIQVGGLTVSGTTGLTVGQGGNQYEFPTTRGIADQVLTVSSTTGQLVFKTPAISVTPTLDQVTDVGSMTLNSISVGNVSATAVEAPFFSSGAGQMEIKTGTTSGMSNPALSIKESNTLVAGVAVNSFFIGDLPGGTGYTFPQTAGSANEVLVATGATNLLFQDIQTLEAQTLDDVVTRGDTTTRSVNLGNTTINGELLAFGGNHALGDTSTVEDIDLGGTASDTVSIIGKINQSILVSGTVELGDATTNISKIYVNEVRSDNTSLTLITSGSDSDISFQPSGVAIAGVTSDSFFMGDNSTNSYYTFPTTRPSTVANQLLAYTSSNTLTFISSSDTDSQTLQQVTDQGTQTTAVIQTAGLVDTSLGETNELLVVGSGDRIISTDDLTIDSDGNIGIGTTTPSRTFHMSSDIQFKSSLRMDQFHASQDGPDILMQKARGTAAAPQANQNGDEIAKFLFYTHDGSNFGAAAGITAVSEVSSPSFGSTLNFFTSPTDNLNVGTATPRLKIDENGEATFSNDVTSSGFSTTGLVTSTGLVDSSLGAENEILVVGSGDRIESTDDLTIDSSGKIGIGTSVPSVTLHMLGEGSETAQIRLDQFNSSQDAPDIRFFRSRGTASSPSAVATNDYLASFNIHAYDGSSYQTSGFMRFYADGTDGDSYFRIDTRVAGSINKRIEIDTSGDVEITGDLTVDDNLTISGSGTVGGTAISSDIRLKSNIVNSPYGLKEILLLDSKMYNKFKTPEKNTFLSEEIGFIAQDVKKIIPVLVHQGEDRNNILNLNYTGFIPILAKAIQEQQEIIESQERRLQHQENRIKDLEALLERVEKLEQAIED